MNDLQCPKYLMHAHKTVTGAVHKSNQVSLSFATSNHTWLIVSDTQQAVLVLITDSPGFSPCSVVTGDQRNITAAARESEHTVWCKSFLRAAFSIFTLKLAENAVEIKGRNTTMLSV